MLLYILNLVCWSTKTKQNGRCTHVHYHFNKFAFLALVPFSKIACAWRYVYVHNTALHTEWEQSENYVCAKSCACVCILVWMIVHMSTDFWVPSGLIKAIQELISLQSANQLLWPVTWSCAFIRDLTWPILTRLVPDISFLILNCTPNLVFGMQFWYFLCLSDTNLSLAPTPLRLLMHLSLLVVADFCRTL